MASDLLSEWHAISYDEENVQVAKKVWEKYFALEKEIYKKILANPDEEISGTVADLASTYDMDNVYFAGFLEGINDSIVKQNPIDKLKDSTKVKIKIDKEKLYYNMVQNKATWLYELPEWDAILTKEKRQELYKKCKDAQVVKREGDKVYPNDPCPCGSGKKNKKCCGKNVA
ncbi:MAG: SEC-C domain-containing protein [Lachnospiraceae bacterium]|nr:SEC-C domain-containing protein [Lachnospiraceae bacterium]